MRKKRAPPSPAYSPSTNALFTMSDLKVPNVNGKNKRHDHRLSPASRLTGSEMTMPTATSTSTTTKKQSKVTKGYRCPIEQHLAHRGSASSSRIRKKKGGSRRSSNQNAFLMNLQKSRASPKAVVEIKQKVSEKVAEMIASSDKKNNNEILWSPTNLLPFSPGDVSRGSVFFPSDDEDEENKISSIPMDAATVEAINVLQLPTPKNSFIVPSVPTNNTVVSGVVFEDVKKKKRAATTHEKEKAINHSKWSKAEDEKLSECVRVHKAKDWKKISKMLNTNRTSVQCLHRYNKVLKPGLKKGPWTAEEDKIVFESVMQYGNEKVKWSDVAMKLGGRMGKQCRERWYNHLDPTIKRGKWTPEEDDKLFQLQRVMGNRWCEICKEIPGRTENMVKNRWYSSAKKKWYKKNGLSLDLSKKGSRPPRRKKKEKTTTKTKNNKKDKKGKTNKKKSLTRKDTSEELEAMTLTFDDNELMDFPTTSTSKSSDVMTSSLDLPLQEEQHQNNTKAVIDFLQMGSSDGGGVGIMLPSPSYDLLLGSPSSMLVSPSNLPPFVRQQQNQQSQPVIMQQIASPTSLPLGRDNPFFSHNAALLSPATQQALWSMSNGDRNSSTGNNSADSSTNNVSKKQNT